MKIVIHEGFDEVTEKAKKAFSDVSAKTTFESLGWIEVRMDYGVSVYCSNHINRAKNTLLSVMGFNDRSRFELFAIELLSVTDQGAFVTSTTSGMIMPQPTKGIYKFSHGRSGVTTLLRHHVRNCKPLGRRIRLSVQTIEEAKDFVENYIKREGLVAIE